MDSTLLTIFTSILWFLVFAWLISLVLTFYGLAQQKPHLTTAPLPKSAVDVPFVSVLVPARNEQQRVLEPCIRSILAQDYPRFEVIAVNDRSTDATGAMLDALAKNDERMRVVEGQELPDGWLGKPYAMQQAVNHARGEWILATDADMIFETPALRTALEYTLENKGDAITLVPHFETGSFWERVMIPTWAWVFLMFFLFSRMGNPKSQGAAAIGGFFLMRRRILEDVGGYEALKDEVMEDVRLAEMIKRSGARLFLEYAPNLLRTRMYSNFSEMWECCTKNWFSGMKYSVPYALSCVFQIYVMCVMPPLIALITIVGIGLGVDLWHWFIPSLLSWLLQVLVLAIVSRRSKVSPAYALTAPLGLGVLYTMLFDSTIRIKTGRGVTWKGRKVYESKGVRPPRLHPSTTRASNVQK